MSANKGFFANFPNRYFIETGSFYGEGIQQALESGCFEHIYSIELSHELQQHCCRSFASNLNVAIIQGDSQEVLPELLKMIDAPATFWLDSHYSSGNTAKGKTNTSLFAELEWIGQHPIKTHTLLIDDVRCFGTADFDYLTLPETIEIIQKINHRYQISLGNGTFLNDILIAQVSSDDIKS
jgi:hypothetical protein